MSIRSLGWDGQLTIDGITSIPFNFGVQGIVEVRRLPHNHRSSSSTYPTHPSNHSPSSPVGLIRLMLCLLVVGHGRLGWQVGNEPGDTLRTMNFDTSSSRGGLDAPVGGGGGAGGAGGGKDDDASQGRIVKTYGPPGVV